MAAHPDDTRTVRVHIKGRVQGVGFRYWTEGVATGLGLSGWVRNRRDGSVEAVFSGPTDTVAEMLERCRKARHPPASTASTPPRRTTRPPPASTSCPRCELASASEVSSAADWRRGRSSGRPSTRARGVTS